MAKLTDLFGRKPGEPETDRKIGIEPLRSPAPVQSGPPVARQITPENYSDIGSRIGEENEALRHLLHDTSRKIGELDELKAAFDKIVSPFNSTLRALEEEKSHTLGLTNMLAESRSSYETLRAEFYQIERKATALEAEAERLREDLELARESNRGLESVRIELTDNVSARGAQIAELERQLAQETAQRRSLGEARRTAQDQLDLADSRRKRRPRRCSPAARVRPAALARRRREQTPLAPANKAAAVRRVHSPASRPPLATYDAAP